MATHENDTRTRTLQDKDARVLRNFLIKTGLVYLVISVALFYLFSALIRNQAYEDMSQDELQHISEMVFESMFTAMLTGAGEKGIEEAARRMNQTGPGMIISVIRGEVIAEKFGETRTDRLRRKNDLNIFEVFKTGEQNMNRKEDRIRYLYPAVFRPQCQQCHDNSNPGEVAAVVEIVYPITNLKVSTGYVDKLMLTYFAISFVVLISFLGWTYRKD